MSFVSLFLILLLAIAAVVLLLTEPTKAEKLVRERLSSLDTRRGKEPIGSSLEDILTRTTFSSIRWLDDYLRRNKFAANLQALFQQANLKWTVGRFLFSSLAAAEFGILLGTYRWPGNLFGWLPGFALGPIPYLIVRYRRSQRFKKFNQLLPDAIDLIARALRAGHSVPAAIELVGEEAKDPLGPEFRRAAEEQAFGLPFREAIMNLAGRMPIADLQFLVTAILVQKETGGNLAEVLDKTSAVLRDRLRLAGQIRIHTAQGKLTGIILALLPIACFFGMSIVQPGYERALFDDPQGQKLIIGAIALMIIGALLMRKIIAIKV